MGNFLGPMPPQLPQLGYGAGGPVGGGAPPFVPPGSNGPIIPQQPAQQYPPNQAVSIVQGIGQFMQNYANYKEHQKQDAAQKFQQGLQMLSLGVPGVSPKAMAKWAKTAELPFDFSGPSQEQLDYQQKLKQYQGIQQAQPTPPIPGPQGPGMPGSMGSIPPPPAGAPPTPPPQQQQPGFLSRLAGAMGLPGGPQQQPPSPASSGMQYLNNLQQQGQANQQYTQKMQGLRSNILDTLTNVMKGDPQAIETAYRLGLGQMLPHEPALYLADEAGIDRKQASGMLLSSMLGIPQQMQQMREMAAKIAGQFPNENGAPDMGAAMNYLKELQYGQPITKAPQRTFEQNSEMTKQADQLMQRLPMLQEPIARMYVEAQAAGQGQSPMGRALTQLIAKSPTQGSQELDKEMRNLALRHEEMGQEHSQFEQTLRQQADISLRSYNLAVAQAVNAASDGQLKTLIDMANQKDVPQSTKNALTQTIVDKINAAGGLQIPGPNGQPIRLTPQELSTKRLSGWEALLTPGVTSHVMGEQPLAIVAPSKHMPGMEAQVTPEGGMPSFISEQAGNVAKWLKGQGLGADEVKALTGEITQKIMSLQPELRPYLGPLHQAVDFERRGGAIGAGTLENIIDTLYKPPVDIHGELPSTP